MAELVLGPLLRHVGERDATVWVETGAPCEVEVLGRRAHTFSVEGHHFALVVLDGLEPGGVYEYGVALDGERRWPLRDSDRPPSRIRTIHPDRPIALAFGSCRISLPHQPPYTLSKDHHELGAEVCALRVRALEMLRQPEDRWPLLLAMLGDQVYVDEGSPAARELIRARRDTGERPGDGPIDFEEYSALYREAWSEPTLRWMLASVPSAMIVDDHDVHDDWNISRAWLDEMESEPWWRDRLRGAFSSYWVYQHLGNLSPRRLGEDPTYAAVLDSARDATDVLRRYAEQASADREGIRWSYRRDLGRTRLVVMDSRGGRVLKPGSRSIFDDEEREWVFAQMQGDFDHLVLATSDPFLLAHGMQYLEAWSEVVCDGAWGGLAARGAEWLRRALDLDHWGAFQTSVRRLSWILREVGSGERGDPPASITVISGDVHHAYLAEIGFPRGSGVRSRVHQAVCSPFRNPLDGHERRAVRVAASRPAWALGRTLARAAGAEDPPVGWRLVEGPFFDNQVATLTLAGRRARLRLEKTVPGETDEHRLQASFERSLA